MINSLVIGNVPTTTFTTMAFVSLSFIILLFLIKKFAWEAISNMLEERANKIASDLDGAEQAKLEADALVQKTEDELTNARSEAAAIIKRAKENAENSANSIVSDAKKEAQNYREKAQRDMTLEREQIIESARREVADLSIQIATKVLKKELNKDVHDDLINSYIEGLGTQNED
ncbi:F0F1 ATP synthase subunit B [Vagococcus intermedius]|uniref:ATP synthase subunit b n=1 Tax=Vagococcus intermedius TaxID=2991418 RepID=A0AAF0CWG8_9ENTE|nr:F0F1 ATP synthase subunit B [Vagococcus intermedius]WEG74091.1 F0F1 ATP synthase subunit B [Vagococcus intermedius]WEG76171.1 F0F1 ATP synthase subunit B [Vagococcus intermedius]